MSDTSAGRLVLDVVASLSGFKQDLQQKLDAETKGITVKVGVKIDTTGLKQQIREAVTRAATGIKAKVGTDLDINSTQMRSQLITALADASKGLAIRIPVTLDDRRLRADVNRAIRKAQAGQKITVPIRSKGGAGGGSSGSSLLNDRDAGGGALAAITSTFKLAALATGATIAAGSITALAGGVIALGAALAPAAGALVAYPGILASVGLAVGTVKLGFSGLGTAMTALQKGQDAQKAAAMGLTAAQYAQYKSLEALTPAQKNLGAYLLSLKPKLDELKQTASSNMLPGLELGLKAVVPLFPIVNQAVGGMAKVISGLGQQAGFAFSQLGPELRNISGMANTVVGNLGGAAVNAISGLLRLTSTGRGLTSWLTGQIKVGAQFLNQTIKTGEENGKLAAFFEKTKAVLSTLGTIVANVGSMIFSVFKGAAPLGNNLLKSIEALTQKGREWTSSVAGQDKIRTFFNNLRPVITAITHLFGDLIKGVAQLGFGASSNLAPLINLLDKELLPALLNIGRVFVANGNNYAPAMIGALTQVAHLFADYASMSGGLGALAGALGTIAHVLDILIRDVPGFSTLLNTFLIFTAARRVMLPMIASIQTFGSTARTAFGLGRALLQGLSGTVVTTGSIWQMRLGAMGAQLRGLFTGATPAGTALRSMLSSIGSGISSFAGTLRSAAAAGGTALVTTMRGLASGAASLARMAWGAIVSGFSGMAAGLQAMKAAAIANPVITIIAVVIALGVAFYELYKHSTAFRNFINEVARVIKTIFVGAFNIMKTVISDVINFVRDHWRLIVVIILGPIGLVIDIVTKYWTAIKRFIMAAITDTIDFVRDHWRLIVIIMFGPIGLVVALVTKYWTAIKNFIVGTIMAIINFVKDHWRLIVTIMFGPIGLVVALVTKYWTAIKNFVMDAITDTINFVRDHWRLIVTIMFGPIGLVVAMVTKYWNYIWTFLKTVMNGILATFKTVWNAIVTVFKTIFEVLKTIVTTQINIIKAVITTALNIIKSIWTTTFNTVKSVANDVWSTVSRVFGTMFNWIKTGFRDAVSYVGRIWDGIKTVVSKPVEFVVNTVYNHGIRSVVNTIAGWVGIHEALPSVHMAKGGVHVGAGQVGSGTSPYDNHPAVYRDGEHVWTPEEVHGAGGHSAVASMRSAAVGKPVSMGPGLGSAYAKGGAYGFDSGGALTGKIDPKTGKKIIAEGTVDGGGIIGGIVGAAKAGWDATGGKAVSAIADLARTGAAFVVDHTLGPLIRQLENLVKGGGHWGEDIAKGMDNTYESFLNWVKGKDAQHEIDKPGAGGSVERWRDVVKSVLQVSKFPTDDAMVNGILSLINMESGGNPNAINLTDSNAIAGHPSQGLMQTIPTTFAAYAGKYASKGITDPFANIYAGVHYAMANYGAGMLRAGGRHNAQGGYVGYAAGGTLTAKPGGHIVRVGEAGRDETILDTASLNAGFNRLKGGRTVNINTTINNPTAEPASTSLNSMLRRKAALHATPA